MNEEIFLGAAHHCPDCNKVVYPGQPHKHPKQSKGKVKPFEGEIAEMEDQVETRPAGRPADESCFCCGEDGKLFYLVCPKCFKHRAERIEGHKRYIAEVLGKWHNTQEALGNALKQIKDKEKTLRKIANAEATTGHLTGEDCQRIAEQVKGRNDGSTGN